MKFNFKVKYTYHFADEYNMVLTQNEGWEPDGDNGKGDCIGRNFDAYFCYEDEKFIEGIKNCWFKVNYEYSNNKFKRFFQKILRRNKKYYYQGYRHPTKEQNAGLSRDHTTNTILAYYLSGMPEEELKEFVTHLRWRISKFARFVPDMWLWVRAIAGFKWAKILYSLIILPTSLFYMINNKIIYKIANFKKEADQITWDEKIKKQKPDKSKYKLKKSLFPAFALKQQAWVLYFLKENFLLKLTKKIFLKINSRYNYVIKMLLGDYNSFSKEDVYNYKPMTKGRWSAVLERDILYRDVKIIKDEKLIKYNNIDAEMVRKLYEERK